MDKGMVLWSGGKDCTIALHKMRQSGMQVTHLVSITYNLPDLNTGTYSILSSGLPKRILEQQAASLGCTLISYELPTALDFKIEDFISFLRPFVTDNTLTHFITGEGASPQFGLWFNYTSNALGMTAVFPNTHSNNNDVNEANYIIDAGYKCKVVSVDNTFYDNNTILGREYDKALLDYLVANPNKTGAITNLVSAGAEFHTVAYDGPEFSVPITLGTSEIKTITTIYQDAKYVPIENVMHFVLFR